MIPQGYPLLARAKDGRQWWVIGWVGEDEFVHPVVVPAVVYGKTAQPVSVVDEDGGRSDRFVTVPAAPVVLDLDEVDGWVGPPGVHL